MLLEVQSGTQLRHHKRSKKGLHALFQVRHSDYSHMPGATCCMLASASTCRAPLQFGFLKASNMLTLHRHFSQGRVIA